MKIKLHIIIVLLISQNIFCQKTEVEEIKPIYIDKCTNQIVEIKRDFIFGFDDIRVLSGIIEKGDWNGEFFVDIDLSSKYDTIIIPKILRYDNKKTVELTENELIFLDNWTYKKCDKICDGIVTEYKKSGEKLLEGIFENGKPIEIKEYDSNGIIANHQYFELGSGTYYKIEYFDDFGKLIEYEENKKRKNKTIYKTFDNNGKLIKRNVVKFEMY